MSVTDPAADPVQPDDGQGGQGNEAPYAEFLNRIPEEVRPQVEPVFKDWDGQVTRRFQEASEYRKQWEPFEQVGVQELEPADIEWFKAFRDAHQNNPEAILEWAKGYATEHGLTLAEQADQAAQQDLAGLDELAGADSAAFEKLLESKLGPVQQGLTRFEQWIERQEQQSRLTEANTAIEHTLKDYESKHPGEISRDLLDPFLQRQVDTVRPGEDPRTAAPRAVNAAIQDFLKFKAQIEKGFVTSKASSPAAPEHGGGTNASLEPITSLADANRIAMQRLREQRGD